MSNKLFPSFKDNPAAAMSSLVVVTLLLAVVPFFAGHFGNAWVRIIDFALLYVMLALGLNIVVGFAGLLDLGYIAFYAVGAYIWALLASPHFGERWARHWLDVVRFGESQGFEYDKIRDNAWHYRDYVIQAFNDDKPYDRFMMEQVAGDVLEPVTTGGKTKGK